MAIYLIDKLQQKNDGSFFLMDAEDVEYDGKSLIDALRDGDIVATASGSTLHVANINVLSGGTAPKAALTPADAKTGDLIVDANGDFYTVTSVDPDGTAHVGDALKTADGGNLSFKGPKGDAGEQGPAGPAGPAGPKGDKFTIAKTYESVDAMNADFTNPDIEPGSFVVISTADTDDPDNAKMFVKSDNAYTFVTDLSGAQGIQGPKGDPGEPGTAGAKGDAGEQGPQGPAGTRGNTISTGDGAPATPPADSIPGDIYIDAATGNLYQNQ